MKAFFLAAIIFSFYNLIFSQPAVTTVDVAQKMGYFDFIKHLKSYTLKYLDRVEDEFKKIVAHLKALGRHQLANQKTNEFKDTYLQLEEAFNQRFVEIDKIINLEGQQLDDDNVSIAKKQELIKKAMKIAKDSVAELTREIKTKSANKYI